MQNILQNVCFDIQPMTDLDNNLESTLKKKKKKLSRCKKEDMHEREEKREKH